MSGSTHSYPFIFGIVRNMMKPGNIKSGTSSYRRVNVFAMKEKSIGNYLKYLMRNVRLGFKKWIWKRFGKSRWYLHIKDLERKYKTKRRAKSDRTERFKQKERLYLDQNSKATPGTADWLIQTEIRFGGFAEFVTIEKLSPHDRRNVEGFDPRPCTGGDRMLHHQYATHYANFLRPFVQDRDRRFVICEFGILKGTGLAIWCDLFPNARCIGLDVDLSNFEKNIDNLRHLGAFRHNTPEVFEYDQFVYSADFLNEILDGDKIDICVDDGNHSDESILTTLDSVSPHLSKEFVYFIEDNQWVHRKIQSDYERYTIFSDSSLSVLTPLLYMVQ